jgi:phosphopantothenoylcysteine decarboxylase/phosphopantothenate--cysteine ligase
VTRTGPLKPPPLSEARAEETGSIAVPPLTSSSWISFEALVAVTTLRRPRLVVGFAAETEKLIEHAQAKRAKKGCDWIIANDVSASAGTFGGDANTVHVLDTGIARFFAQKAAE